ncbi:MAG TPA: hypothetical protein VG676_06435 [Chitinophagaceae bacterium]|jgi:uncharacterized membrane protein YphA (DoxX/SURF4 family)|nr:hypothetical protein [Chitinophagaceae bacterium]
MDTSIQSSQQILKYTYGLVPIVAGLDKFTNILTNWKDYINTSLLGILPFSSQTFMIIVGIIEIAAGILVLLRPRIGASVVIAWLIVIALSLVLSGHYLDVAVRDLVMAVGAFVLVKLSVPASPRVA